MTEEMFWPEVIREAPIPEGFTIEGALDRVKGSDGEILKVTAEISGINKEGT